jgi:hypothetical protein
VVFCPLCLQLSPEQSGGLRLLSVCQQAWEAGDKSQCCQGAAHKLPLSRPMSFPINLSLGRFCQAQLSLTLGVSSAATQAPNTILRWWLLLSAPQRPVHSGQSGAGPFLQCCGSWQGWVE